MPIKWLYLFRCFCRLLRQLAEAVSDDNRNRCHEDEDGRRSFGTVWLVQSWLMKEPNTVGVALALCILGLLQYCLALDDVSSLALAGCRAG